MSKKWVRVKDWVTSRGVDYPPGEHEMPEESAKSIVTKGLGEYVEDGGDKSNVLPIKETIERMSQGDLSDEVLDSMKVHRDVIQEAQKSGKPLRVFLDELSEKEKSAQKSDDPSSVGDPKDKGKTEDGLPEDFPTKTILEKPNKHSETGFKTVAEVQALTREQLIEIDGIADKTADKILTYGK